MSTTWKVAIVIVGLAIAASVAYLGWTIGRITTQALPELPSIERAKTYVALGFSAIVALAFLFSLFAMFFLRLKNPTADISVWLNIALTCLGYIVGILAGLFGLPAPAGTTPGSN